MSFDENFENFHDHFVFHENFENFHKHFVFHENFHEHFVYHENFEKFREHYLAILTIRGVRAKKGLSVYKQRST